MAETRTSADERGALGSRRIPDRGVLTPFEPGPYTAAMLPSCGKETVERLADLGHLTPSIQLVILFGSAASGRARPHSDLDIAVLGDGPVDLDALYVPLAARLGSDRLDLVDVRTAGSALAFEVARHGKPLFQRTPGAFRRFQALASLRCGDTAKLRRAQQRAIQVFLERQGGVMSPVDAAYIGAMETYLGKSGL